MNRMMKLEPWSTFATGSLGVWKTVEGGFDSLMNRMKKVK
jgi:hypothetical protein